MAAAAAACNCSYLSTMLISWRPCESSLLNLLVSAQSMCVRQACISLLMVFLQDRSET